MKSPAEYLAAAHANSMPPAWCATRVAEIRAWVDCDAPASVLVPTLRTWLIELLSQLDSSTVGAEAAVSLALADAEKYKTNLVGAVLRSHPSTLPADVATSSHELPHHLS